MTPLGKATCRTCGATGPPWHHQPSPLDPAGIGDPGHAMKDKQDADLDEIIKDLVTGAISWNNYGNTESIGYEERAKQALDQYITDLMGKFGIEKGVKYDVKKSDTVIVLTKSAKLRGKSND
jgi:hypothetical protein